MNRQTDDSMDGEGAHDSVSVDDWVIDERLLNDAARKSRLIEVPSALDLVGSVAQAAGDAAREARIQLVLLQSHDEPDYFRVEAKIPLPEMLFDQLFNGRSGYRAQYYISAAQGASFNQKIVHSLIPAILASCRCKIFKDETTSIKQSLIGRYSKIWVVGDGKAFLDSPAALEPARWVSYWQGNDNAFGLRLPCPAAPQLDLKGTFVKPETDEEWVYEGKKDRNEEIFRKGWT